MAWATGAEKRVRTLLLFQSLQFSLIRSATRTSDVSGSLADRIWNWGMSGTYESSQILKLFPSPIPRLTPLINGWYVNKTSIRSMPNIKNEENLINDIPGPASEEEENLTDELVIENSTEDEAKNFLMGAPLSRLKGTPLCCLMGVSGIMKTVREIYSSCEELDHSYYRPLYHAALKGDWQAAKCFLEANPDAATARVSVFGRTAMHVAAIEGHAEFVEKFLEVMPAESVALPDVFGQTALHIAAGSLNMKSVKALVRKYPTLTQSMDHKGWTPLIYAVGGGFDQKEMSSSQRSEYKEVI